MLAIMSEAWSRGATWLAVVLQLLDLLLDELVERAGLAFGALALVCAPLPDWRVGGLCRGQAAGQRPGRAHLFSVTVDIHRPSLHTNSATGTPITYLTNELAESSCPPGHAAGEARCHTAAKGGSGLPQGAAPGLTELVHSALQGVRKGAQLVRKEAQQLHSGPRGRLGMRVLRVICRHGGLLLQRSAQRQHCGAPSSLAGVRWAWAGVGLLLNTKLSELAPTFIGVFRGPVVELVSVHMCYELLSLPTSLHYFTRGVCGSYDSVQPQYLSSPKAYNT